MHLDQDVLKALSPEDKQELEIWEELIASRGYEQLRLLLSQQKESMEAIIQTAQNWDQYLYARGSRDGLNLVLNLEAILEDKLKAKAHEVEEIDEDLSEEYDEISVNLDLR